MFIEAEDVPGWRGFSRSSDYGKTLLAGVFGEARGTGLGMGVTLELREDQSQGHYQALLAKLAAHQ